MEVPRAMQQIASIAHIWAGVELSHGASSQQLASPSWNGMTWMRLELGLYIHSSQRQGFAGSFTWWDARLAMQ